MSRELFEDAQKHIAGGVNSPIRAFKGLGIPPVFIKKGFGKKITDSEGNQYTDYCLSWGALLLGHANPIINEAVIEALRNGTSFGAPTEQETEYAKMIKSFYPSIEKLRLVNSGTEAVMSAIRLSRGFTGRDKIIKFDGCYHGHSDSLLVNAGSGVAENKSASSKGVPDSFVENTISIPFNNPEILKSVIEKEYRNIACVIVEPVPANMGLILPDNQFLETLRKITLQYGIVLIFDEVISGFRVSPGGVQEYYSIKPDLTILGKIAGGGMPLGVFGGKSDIMNCLSPDGEVYQAGTLSGNPIAVASGLAVLKYINDNRNIYTIMSKAVTAFSESVTNKTGLTVNSIGSAFTIFHTNKPVRNFEEARKQDLGSFKSKFINFLQNGIYMPCSMYETAFISIEHDEKDLEKVVSLL